MCSSGKIPAQATANSVMASAKRLMELRHGCRNNSKNGGDQRAGVADTDPPDEIDDGKAPADGNIDAPNAHADDKQVADRTEASACDEGKRRQAQATILRGFPA